MTINKPFILIALFVTMGSTLIYSADQSKEALKCANATVAMVNSGQRVFGCDRCENMTFSSSYKYVLHKHNTKECIPNKACIDCQLSNQPHTVLLNNNRAALAHANYDHRDMKGVHCYLCGLFIEKKLYEDHLDNKFHMLVKKVKTDISNNDSKFSKIKNSFYKDE